MDRQKTEAIAAERRQIIAPLVEDEVDAALRRPRTLDICAQTGLSDRTLRRWVVAYQAAGLPGLSPAARPATTSAAIAPAVLDLAIQLRREAPHRSVRPMIPVLEWEGRVAPGALKRSTLPEQLMARGYSARQRRQYRAEGVAARRCQRTHRHALWQGDIKYGPRRPGGPGQAPHPTYLSAIIDDATRYVVHAAWYPTQDETIVQDSLRTAMRRYGVPRRLYFDNGKQYRSHQMARMAAQLGIRVVYTKPYAPESKGKIERFNRVVHAFLAEVRLDRPTTLEAFNAAWDGWLTECYQTQPHRALPNAPHPEAACRGDPEPLRFGDTETLTAAFQRVEGCQGDKTGCVSVRGQAYEVGGVWVGQRVDVVYDPADVSTVTIEAPGAAPGPAHPVEVGEHTGPRPALPDHLGAAPVALCGVSADGLPPPGGLAPVAAVDPGRARGRADPAPRGQLSAHGPAFRRHGRPTPPARGSRGADGRHHVVGSTRRPRAQSG